MAGQCKMMRRQKQERPDADAGTGVEATTSPARDVIEMKGGFKYRSELALPALAVFSRLHQLLLV